MPLKILIYIFNAHKEAVVRLPTFNILTAIEIRFHGSAVFKAESSLFTRVKINYQYEIHCLL